MTVKRIAAACLAAALLCAAGPVCRAEEGGRREAFENAYRNQAMPDADLLPALPEEEPAPRRPYDSVTQANLQGRWVHRYREGGVDVEEILTVNGDGARIEDYEDGAPTSFWNGEGMLTIEDRSYRGVCPAVRVETEDGNGCAIYVRRVGEDAFFDGMALDEWVREAPEDPWDQYLFDTVTLERLQGVWYGEYEEDGRRYQDILTLDGDAATLFETVDGVPGSVWNGAGTAWIEMVEHMREQYVPELMIGMESGAAAGGQAGIAISRVDDDRFYDALFHRWFVRIGEPEEDRSEGSLLFSIYGNGVEKTDEGYVFTPFDMDERLLLDWDTELVHPELLDGWEEGDDAVQWIDRLMNREPETMQASGVYDVDVTGGHIDRVYGLYWWD